MCLVSGIAQSSNIKVKGNVVDAKTLEPILNCNIYLSGTQWGTTSNMDGDFEIQSIIPSEYEIVFPG